MSEVEANAGGRGKEQDRFLPIANIGRIMRRAVPENGKIARDARESIQECVSEFISFITSEASDKCVKERRKTINGDDIIWSLGTLGFEEYVEPLKIYLNNYQETEGDTKGSKSSDQNGKKQMLLNGELGSSLG
ncbi:nuclear transcription factor Y subunit B-4 [Zea mays]|uniref:nuclear transcription factor Y subunit B-4 n=1 Tax=Zea mays TaxID=4577 RepID=UPI0009A9E72C|nr:nuclear transcription factor Y subunit B-4 [Zea mays]|eukprot:XP_020398603.1 nuclear transcription factor Y subunit B-4 [Zea mays]